MVLTMSGMTEIAEAVFGSSPIRTGYSKDKKAAFAVAADIKGVMNYTSTLNAFLRGLEKQQEIAGQGKGNSIVAPLYTGLETVQTAGGPQKMKNLQAWSRSEVHTSELQSRG